MGRNGTGNQCGACGAGLDRNDFRCPICGFPVLIPLGDAAAAEQNRKEAGAAFCAEILARTEIGFLAFRHTVVRDSDGNERIRVQSEDELPFGLFAALPEETILWFPETFLRPGGRSLSCTVYIKDAHFGKRKIPLSLEVPDGAGDLRFGAERGERDGIRFCLGNSREIRKSMRIRLLSLFGGMNTGTGSGTDNDAGINRSKQ